MAPMDAVLWRGTFHLLQSDIQFCRCLHFGLSNLHADIPEKVLYKRVIKKTQPTGWVFFCVLSDLYDLFLYLFNKFLSGKMDSALNGAKVETQFICNLLVLVTAVMHLERYSEFWLQ